MTCIDKSLTPEQVEDRIERYVLDTMTEEERAQFEEHFSDCEFCEIEADTGQRVTKILDRKFAYEDLLKANEAKDYKRVIELGQKMRQLGCRESLYPVAEIVEKATAEFKKTLIDKASRIRIDTPADDKTVKEHLEKTIQDGTEKGATVEGSKPKHPKVRESRLREIRRLRELKEHEKSRKKKSGEDE